MRVALVTVGCPKNSADTDLLSAQIAAAGLDVVSDPASADAIIVNTCGFISSASEESLDTIMELASFKRDGTCTRLIVCGCLPARYGNELAVELAEADAVFGLATQCATHIISYLTGRLADQIPCAAPRLRPATHYAYVKVSDGCDRACSFCTIPAIRGHYRSRPLLDIEAEVADLVATGIKEIILVGQETTSWGRDLAGRPTIASLLSRLSTSHDVWFRLMYLQPDGVADELIEAVADLSNVCSYFDIPFQHASRDVLSRMRRQGSAESFLNLLERIRALAPGAALRTSLIVGFPGETEADFERLVAFVRSAGLDYAGLFAFSPEEGTAAASMSNQLASELIAERHRLLADLADDIASSRAASRIGQEFDVLVDLDDTEQESASEGRSQCQAPDIDGVCRLDEHHAPGSLVHVQVRDSDGYDLICRGL